MSLFLSQLINGLQIGSIYALVALGYTMVYGIVKLLNFAHGDIIMVGGYIALFSLTAVMFPPVVAALLTVAGCTLLAIIIEKLAYKPLRNAPRLSLLITAIGVSILLQNLAQIAFGANGRPFPAQVMMPTGVIQFGGIIISYVTLITIVVSVLSMAGLTILVQKSKLGKAMRAVSEDMGASQLMGINVNHVITFTFAVGAALAGIGAIMYSVQMPMIMPTIGALLGLRAFVAAVLGGIGSIPGTMIGGYIIGIIEAMAAWQGLNRWVDAVVFLILILVLLIRPAGIMGRNMMEKV